MHYCKLFFSLIIVIVFLFLNQICTAQSPVSLSGSIGGGLLLPQSSHLKANMTNVTYDYPLSKTGYDFNGKIRIGLSVLPIKIVGTVSYNSLSDKITLPVYTTSGIVNSNYTYALSMMSVGIGVEYNFLPLPVIKPYIEVSAVMNFISGSASYEDNVIPESKLNSTSRLGLNLGIGALIDADVLPFSIDIEAKYKLANAAGKGFDNMGYNYNGFGGLPQTSTYNLNDAKNPNDPNDYARSINYITITLGVNITIL